MENFVTKSTLEIGMVLEKKNGFLVKVATVNNNFPSKGSRLLYDRWDSTQVAVWLGSNRFLLGDKIAYVQSVERVHLCQKRMMAWSSGRRREPIGTNSKAFENNLGEWFTRVA